ncbi:putative oxidoreductase [Neolecta irregularis DAH-3]|uniref:Putative oxidoreductase n=1 Tax=Neolecta irregularis (strain DAH-3) TaxID=1198029 RepID=A0A1U7LK32_NEOID|nr:putative oxidoreductase [Neolecta irregularis DAH-3]|eukprot:OLL22881.1 putative oxidoreductase [Neolecta irregularis DAH-3]
MHISSLGIYPHTRNFDVDKDIPDLTGKVYVVTGGTYAVSSAAKRQGYGGLGLETTFQLLRHNATVYIAGKSKKSALTAISSLKERLADKYSVQNPTVYFHHLDLENIQACVDSARDLGIKTAHIDCIIANAGISFLPFYLTRDGIENCMAHLGHFTFVTRLLAKMNDGARVVVVSSEAHEIANKINYYGITSPLANPEWLSIFGVIGPASRYAQSKFANVLFANKLARDNPRLLVNACHPGLISTGINRSAGAYTSFFNSVYNWVLSLIGMSIKDGATTQLFLATATDIERNKVTGKYFSPIALETESSKASRDINAADELWEWSETKVKETIMDSQIKDLKIRNMN